MDTTDKQFDNLQSQFHTICVSERSTPTNVVLMSTPSPNLCQLSNNKSRQSAFLFPPPELPARNSSIQVNDDDYHHYHEPIDPDNDTENDVHFDQDSTTQLVNNRKDVSDDIYSCYVSNANRRIINLRSRSYHGPKNDVKQPSTPNPFVRNAPKNLSANSVVVCDDSLANIKTHSSIFPPRIRDHCVRELIETESNYVHALDMIKRCFIIPLRGYLKRDEIQQTFNHILEFHKIHSSFQAELIKAAYKKTNSNPTTPTSLNNIHAHILANPNLTVRGQLLPLNGSSTTTRAQSQIFETNKTLSLCFIKSKEKFLKYADYCTSLTKAQNLLDELSSKNDTFATQLARCQQLANDGKFKLRDLLSLPMQRILKYHLLLAQLIENTSDNHEDYHSLKRAHETMVDLGQYINEVKRDNEAIQIIDEIENSIFDLDMPTNTHLVDYGRLITDGYVRVRLPDETKVKRYVFVFDKVMIMCKIVRGVRGEQYYFKEALVLDEFDFETSTPLATGTLNFRHETRDKWTHGFKLVKNQTTYSFFVKSTDMKKKWIAAIGKALDNVRPISCRAGRASSHNFEMYTFEKATSCDHCDKLMHGLFYQGYKCKDCSLALHKKCLVGPIRHCRHLSTPRIQTLNSRVRVQPQSPSIISISSSGNSPISLCFTEATNSYVNFSPDDYPWFCGQMDRDEAQTLLEDRPSETFLVRISPKQNGSYVISLNYNSQVKHMRIHVSNNQLFLSENRYFKSLVDLVTW